MSRVALAVCAALLVSTPVLGAQKLPKNAKPFTADEVTAVYSGNTMQWSAGGGFFAPDGKMAAYWSKKGEEGYAEGKWSVTGNEFCYSASWKNATKPLDEEFCWKMYHVGKKTYYEETKASDGRALKITPKSPPVSNGDKATKQAEAIKEKLSK